ncbi:MAG TPA: T9SS type A sorting domain-containing protein [bacterium]|jgi:hypothetical protein
MSPTSKILTTLTLVIILSTATLAQQVHARADRWTGLTSMQNDMGLFGFEGGDPCDSNRVPGLELPGGSGQQYLGYAALWVGGLIIEQGFETKRVSTATDGWLSPSINELWPVSGAESGIVETSRRDTVDCHDENIHDVAALADHQFTTVFADTFRDPGFVENDPIDGGHRPLGVKITRTTYSMMDAPGNHIYWIRYHLENIASNFLKNLYLGVLLEGEVRDPSESHSDDDLFGFDPASNVAYHCDNDGRREGDSTGNNFTVPNAVGFCFLTDPENRERLSFNWWMSHGEVEHDFGPAWEDYALRDSMELGWTRLFGTPMGDEHKYQLMSNGEQDYDQARTADSAWIAGHPQQGKVWSRADYPDNAFDIANGSYARALLSVGPTGVYDYTDQSGRRIYRLNPGEECDVWMACVGGLNFHNPERPQPGNRVIDPVLFDLTDLRAHVQTARLGLGRPWLAARESHSVPPVEFTLSPVYPNPFNASTRIRFDVSRAGMTQINVYDVMGRLVQTLAAGTFSAGHHEVRWDASGLSSGVYFVRAIAAGQSAVQKALLLR